MFYHLGERRKRCMAMGQLSRWSVALSARTNNAQQRSTLPVNKKFWHTRFNIESIFCFVLFFQLLRLMHSKASIIGKKRRKFLHKILSLVRYFAPKQYQSVSGGDWRRNERARRSRMRCLSTSNLIDLIWVIVFDCTDRWPWKALVARALDRSNDWQLRNRAMMVRKPEPNYCFDFLIVVFFFDNQALGLMHAPLDATVEQVPSFQFSSDTFELLYFSFSHQCIAIRSTSSQWRLINRTSTTFTFVVK